MTKRNKKGYVYILFNKQNGTLYTGVTSDLLKRVYDHKNKLTAGFTSRYRVDKLGYYEVYARIIDAIERKSKSRAAQGK